jgi:multidrug efflux system membrane fusion protein
MKVFRPLMKIPLPICTILLALCNRQEPRQHTPAAPRTISVTIGPVIRDTIPLPLFFPGKLAAAAELRLGFKTGGIIREITAIEGAAVARGACLARLDTIELAAWHEKALTALDKSRRDLTRAEQLFNDSVATLEQLQNARSALRAAASDADIASFNLAQAVLRAPTAGKILKRLGEKNEVTGPGMPVVLFASTEGSWVIKTAVPDRDLSIVDIGDYAEISFDAVPNRTFSATLTGIAGAAHPVTGTFEIDLTLDTTAREFRPGLVANVKLFPKGQQRFAFIPASALAEGSGDSGIVYSPGPGTAFTAVPVVIERLFGNLIAVSSGLEGIDTIVTTGAPYLRFASEQITIARTREH